VRTLLALFLRYLRNEVRQLHADNVRVRFIGQRHRFGERLQRLMRDSEALTAGNRAATLVIAMDYGGRWDIVQAARSLALQVRQGTIAPEDISEERLAGELVTADLPPPDLCIRTGGETRISNFELWQLAYSELYFTPVLWPDFDIEELRRAVRDYGGRERRFGKRNLSAVAEPSVTSSCDALPEITLPAVVHSGRA
jgi:undecaprenyl diphosphate synthase